MERYVFFYDESFHDRKITAKNNEINIYSGNASDVYVGAFIGFSENKLSTFIDKYSDFERGQKKVFDISESKELKATIISYKNFEYGIKTFRQNTLDFYDDYFSLFDENTIIHICMLSKTSVLITETFKNIDSIYLDFNKNAFIYSLTKFLYNYRYNEILLNFFNDYKEYDSDVVINKLSEFITGTINNIQKSKSDLKILELKALEEIRTILEYSIVKHVPQRQYLWNYNIIFKGLNLLLEEFDIPQKHSILIIDRDENTITAARTTGEYLSIIDGDSKKYEGIRASDILSNFIGRMIYSLTKDLQVNVLNSLEDLENINYKTKKILNPNWFDLNEKQFNIYKKVKDIFITRIEEYGWTTQGSVYFDYSTTLFNLFQYIGYFDSFNDFCKLDAEKHSNEFNKYCCCVLRERYKMDFGV